MRLNAAKGSPTGVKLARKHLLISKNCRQLKLRASAHSDPGVVQTIPKRMFGIIYLHAKICKGDEIILKWLCMKRLLRLGLCGVLLLIGYQLVRHPALRVYYAPWDKFAHATAFFTVWWMLFWASRWPAVWVSLLAAFLGGAIEIHQMFLIGFSPSWSDWMADLAGIALAGVLWAQWCVRRNARPAAEVKT